MDPALECQYSCRGAEVAAIVAYKCLSQNPKSRPTMREVVKTLEPVLGMDDFFPAGPFVFTISVEDDKVVGVKVEVEEKPQRLQQHRSHQDRHRQKYPNSSIHAGIALHSREGVVGDDYTIALRRQRRASSYRRERGA
ncbi:serine/threonine-protein kinase [Panicum miliaceum]|uniref:Serine/threonine-protein kinase n=1 Tax=Panicum miliaceum TaxID=4540 RepID=A0A3L6T9W2_PANMI|nr:serine/threonine-protein kinase [Panicum miliaceum]